MHRDKSEGEISMAIDGLTIAVQTMRALAVDFGYPDTGIDFDVGEPIDPWYFAAWEQGWLFSSSEGSLYILDVGEPEDQDYRDRRLTEFSPLG